VSHLIGLGSNRDDGDCKWGLYTCGGRFEPVCERRSRSSKPEEYGGWWWAKVIALCSLAGLFVVVLSKWVGPLIIKKVVIPFTKWETRTLDAPVLAFVIFASIALFPTILLPTSPSMWVAGLSFGYGFGFLLVMAGVAIGITLPYFIGSRFQLKVHKWLEKYPEQASVLRSAGEGSWFHQFKAVMLIRLSPFPYVLFNYAVVAADIAYSPYLLGSLVGTIHEVLLSLYSGILMRALAEAADDKKVLGKPHATFNTFGFCAGLVAMVLVGIWVMMRRSMAERT
ncbi:Golgi apparatus membrane protein TVP38-like, partial [Punica granatum]|uniref:Golgi apparatus membrane protein TVP38-like n=1 Tax=Punica granatum TaxID=22663 RepID=A0A6P8DME4_PUNGR